MAVEFFITEIGGSRLRMATTSWTVVCKARGTGPTAREAFTTLYGLYLKPVYMWFRGKGLRNEDAKDLADDFFARAWERKDLFEKWDRAKGSFKSFVFRRLRWAWLNYLRSREQGASVSLSEEALEDQPDSAEPPDVELEKLWAKETLDTAQRTLADDLASSGREVRLRVFEHRVWQGLSVAETASSLGINEDRVKNDLRAYERDLLRTLKRIVRATVHSDAEVKEELDLIVQYARA